MIRYEGFRNLVKGKELVNKKISVEYLMPWNCLNLTKVSIKIWKIKTRINPSKPNIILKQIELKNYLAELPKK